MACHDPCWHLLAVLGQTWLLVHTAIAANGFSRHQNIVATTFTREDPQPERKPENKRLGSTRPRGFRRQVAERHPASGDGNEEMTSSEVLMAMGMGSDDGCSLLDRRDEDSLEDMTINPDELLSPLSRLQKYVHSEIIFNRQVVARSLLDTLRSVVGNPEQVDAVFTVIAQLSNDSEPSVRAELMEQVAPIASFCREQNGHCPARLTSIVPVYLVPIIVRYLTDINNQVRKAAQSALLVMLEQQLVDRGQLERDICPLVLQLTETNNMDDHRTEAVVLMSKMAPLVGQEITKKLFLARFSNLCEDNSFHVRKVCATHFGEFCAVVGMEATEGILLSRFYRLCEDSVWGVRKPCAEVFMPVSCVCSMKVRMASLAPLFVHLLCDQSRWVKIAAFQALGPFISTFADPTYTGLYYSQDGVLVLDEDIIEATTASYREATECAEVPLGEQLASESVPVSQQNITLAESETSSASLGTESQDILTVITNPLEGMVNWMDLSEDNFLQKEEDDLSLEEQRALHYETSFARLNDSQEQQSATVLNDSADGECLPTSSGSEEPQQRTERSSSFVVRSSGEGRIHVHMDNETAYNAFQYWRMPLPELELDIDIVGNNQASVYVRARVPDSQSGQVYASNMSFKLTTHQNNNNNNNNGLFLLQPQVGSVVASMRSMQLKEGHDQQQNPGVNRTAESQMHVESSCLSSVLDSQIARVLDSSYDQACLTFVQGELQGIKKQHSVLYDYDQFLPNQLNSNNNNNNNHFMGKNRYGPCEQEIVPTELLEQYLSMTDSTKAHMIDTEIARYCAYSFPAVALTLGRKHWPCLRRTFEILASDLQWKVRRTLASSMHELAMILGCDLASQDLLPVFVGFLGDLDEVRIGILQHLALFLKLLRPSERRDFLPQVTKFLKIDNERNWRFRLALAEQLIEMVEIYSPSDVRQYLVPLALSLVKDRVCHVRQVALRVLAILLRRVGKSSEPSLLKELLGELAEMLTHATKWSNRQTFAFLCELVIEEGSLSAEQFARDLLPHLLYLGWDKVPNVRMAVSRCLATRLLPHEYFSSGNSPHYELLVEALLTLQKDVDRDVRHFASLATDLPLPQQQPIVTQLVPAQSPEPLEQDQQTTEEGHRQKELDNNPQDTIHSSKTQEEEEQQQEEEKEAELEVVETEESEPQATHVPEPTQDLSDEETTQEEMLRPQGSSKS